jgi:hypothetical protein
MVIKFFAFILLFLSISAYFVPVENIKKNIVDNDAPIVIFEAPSMYTIDENGINRIIYANNAVKYNNRDEMYNADVTLKNLDETQKFKSENLKADLIVKIQNNYTLTNNVKYTRDDFIKLNTEELFYDDTKKIANNSKPFDAIYNNHSLKGDTFHIDINNNFVKAKNTHFEIDVTKKN